MYLCGKKGSIPYSVVTANQPFIKTPLFAKWVWYNFVTHFHPVVQNQNLDDLLETSNHLSRGQLVSAKNLPIKEIRDNRLIVGNDQVSFYFNFPQREMGNCHDARKGDSIDIHLAMCKASTCFDIQKDYFCVNSNYNDRNTKGL